MTTKRFVDADGMVVQCEATSLVVVKWTLPLSRAHRFRREFIRMCPPDQFSENIYGLISVLPDELDDDRPDEEKTPDSDVHQKLKKTQEYIKRILADDALSKQTQERKSNEAKAFADCGCIHFREPGPVWGYVPCPKHTNRWHRDSAFNGQVGYPSRPESTGSSSVAVGDKPLLEPPLEQRDIGLFGKIHARPLSSILGTQEDLDKECQHPSRGVLNDSD